MNGRSRARPADKTTFRTRDASPVLPTGRRGRKGWPQLPACANRLHRNGARRPRAAEPHRACFRAPGCLAWGLCRNRCPMPSGGARRAARRRGLPLNGIGRGGGQRHFSPGRRLPWGSNPQLQGMMTDATTLPPQPDQTARAAVTVHVRRAAAWRNDAGRLRSLDAIIALDLLRSDQPPLHASLSNRPRRADARGPAVHRSSRLHDQTHADRYHPRGRNPRGGAGR